MTQCKAERTAPNGVIFYCIIENYDWTHELHVDNNGFRWRA